MTKIKNSFVKVLTGSELASRKLPLMIAKSNVQGPRVWLTACSHGDEVGGMVVVQEIMKRLEKYPLLKGSIYAFPLMNPMGFEVASEDIVIDSGNLNRSFPGDKNGTIAERIAETIFSTIMKTKPSLVLDLHNDWRNSIPYILLDAKIKNPNIREKDELLAKKSGLLIVKETKEDLNEGLDKSLSYTLNNKNIPSLTLELGESDIVNEKNVEDGVGAIWNLLEQLKMVEEIREEFNYQYPQVFNGKILKYSQQYINSTTGVIRFFSKPGTIVKKGQLVARVYNSFGKLQENVTALNDGIITGYSNYSVAIPGVPIIAFGII